MVDSGTSKANQTLDCITRQEMDKLAIGEILEVWADDPAAEEDLKAWAKHAGQKILAIERADEGMRFLVQKEK